LPFRCARHTGYVVLGVHAAAASRGLGRDLLAAKQQARGRGLRRLELTMMTGNLRALSRICAVDSRVEGLRGQLAPGSRPSEFQSCGHRWSRWLSCSLPANGVS
jgi:GNAT superfamily N-acetyltransferase